jgi:retron-type reverse transcriptase
MKSLLHELNEQSVWLEYLEYKTEKGHFSKKDTKELTEFINAKKYEAVTDNILSGGKLSIPQKSLINKLGGGKRIVYSFSDDENKVLKLLAFLLYRYDNKQSPKCYSFRKGFGAHKAIFEIVSTRGISKMWCYKLDIKDYFNSISVPILLSVLDTVIDDDKLLEQFFCMMLSEHKSVYENQLIEEKRGVMAGTPTSPFLANIYLKELDTYFAENNVVYARYSDDIIVFAQTEEELMQYKKIMYEFLDKYELTVNTKKEKISRPEQAWEYLGVEYQNGEIDLSPSSKQKLKGKISRKARALRRWKLRKNVCDDQTMKAMIRIFNRKFFENNNPHELTWSRWFFPLVTVPHGFNEIDLYLQQYIRYIPTGCHGKKNYKTTYGKLKELGYRSLVNEYYRFTKEQGLVTK